MFDFGWFHIVCLQRVEGHFASHTSCPTVLALSHELKRDLVALQCVVMTAAKLIHPMCQCLNEFTWHPAVFLSHWEEVKTDENTRFLWNNTRRPESNTHETGWKSWEEQRLLQCIFKKKCQMFVIGALTVCCGQGVHSWVLFGHVL